MKSVRMIVITAQNLYESWQVSVVEKCAFMLVVGDWLFSLKIQFSGPKTLVENWGFSSQMMDLPFCSLTLSLEWQTESEKTHRCGTHLRQCCHWHVSGTARGTHVILDAIYTSTYQPWALHPEKLYHNMGSICFSRAPETIRTFGNLHGIQCFPVFGQDPNSTLIWYALRSTWMEFSTSFTVDMSRNFPRR